MGCIPYEVGEAANERIDGAPRTRLPDEPIPMPILIAVVGATTTILIWWLTRGDGLRHLDRALHDWRNTRMRRRAEAAFRASPLRTIESPADAAGVLMQFVVLARGMPTPEQEAAIEAELRQVLPAGEDVEARLVYIRHAANQAADAGTAVDLLAPLLRERLDRSEHAHLERMLESVAMVHGGPTDAQEALIARTVHAIAEQR